MQARRRVTHCGTSPAALQTVKYNGISTYCFRCGETVWEPREPELRRPVPQPTLGRDPPKDLGDPWPLPATAWLGQLGFGRYEREQFFGCYWSARFERIVFPLHNGFWTARSLVDKPKWLSSLVGRSGCVQEYVTPRLAGASGTLPVVLTEDILSAAKIALADVPFVAIPCLGTLPSAAVLARAATAPRVVWWLDPDKYGQMHALGGSQRLLALGVPSHIMAPVGLDDQDPKYLPTQEIQRRLAIFQENHVTP